MAEELSKVYDPKITEQQADQIWAAGNYFHAEPDGAKRKPYTIVIPPPNVTAALHLGHALNNTLQDILIRYHRMLGLNTLWMPGTDHAGIATQTVVEKRILAEEGKKRTDFKRDEFVARVQAWKDEYEIRIIEQLKAMGCSCDWQRTRFTMDETCAKAVRATFFNLFKDGLIYRGKRLVNWDPATQTVLADDEVEHETIQGNFWYLRYPLAEPIQIDGKKIEYITVATTRPETMLGDTAIAMNPNDPRAKFLVGKSVRLPIVGRIIPIIADEHVVLPNPNSEDEKAKFSTGFLKVTPAHDPDDWAIGQRHKLEVINVMAPDGSISDKFGWTDWEQIKNPDAENLIGLDRFEAREAIVEWFRQENLLEEIRPYAHEVGHSYRSHVPIEPYLSDQWYIAVKKPIQGGTGFQPVNENTQGNTSSQPLDDQVNKRNGAYLPHWTQAEAIYAVTFRLADSLPANVLEQWRIERDKIDQNAASQGREPTSYEQQELDRLNSEKVESYLDAGHGQCYLRESNIAELVANALKHFDSQRYDLIAWAVMPNHVHAVVKPREGFDLPGILHSWKSYTANKANELLERTGAFWQTESYDHLIRDENDFRNQVNYILSNPAKAGLKNWPWVDMNTSDVWNRWIGGTGFQPVDTNIEQENTAKMAVLQGLIEGTDVPINSLAGLALKPLLDGRLKFIPERYAKTYQAWLENLRDWPISRQLWWGHQIPIWSKNVILDKTNWSQYAWAGRDNEGIGFRQRFVEKGTGRVVDTVGPDESMFGKEWIVYITTAREDASWQKYNLERNGWRRDEDVLDTWFSSALWPFSTLGWPDESPALKTFYPGDVLCTAREIITLWVSRMVMMGQYCCGDIPFKDVYIHAMIQDGEGRKMSKSLGNGIDPLVAINSHGADAMRFTLASMTTDTQDIRMPVAQMTLPDGRVENTSPKLDVGRNFCNKLWNASRFAMMNLEGTDQALFDKNKLAITDKWILSRLARTIAEVTAGLDAFKYNEPLNAIYKFFWNDFCDWYLEWAKPRMSASPTARAEAGETSPLGGFDSAQKPIAQNVLAFVLDQTLRLLHPFVPFITEGIFQKLNELAPTRGLKGIAELNAAKALVIADWPKRIDALINEQIERQIDNIQTVVRSVRDIRSKCNIPPSSKLVVSVNAPQELSGILNADAGLLCQLANLKEFNVSHTTEKPKNAAAAIAGQMQIYVHDAIDVVAERKRLTKQKEQIEGAKKGVETKLANENFISRAKPEVVAQAKEKLAEYTEQLKAVEKHLAELDD